MFAVFSIGHHYVAMEANTLNRALICSEQSPQDIHSRYNKELLGLALQLYLW